MKNIFIFIVILTIVGLFGYNFYLDANRKLAQEQQDQQTQEQSASSNDSQVTRSVAGMATDTEEQVATLPQETAFNLVINNLGGCVTNQCSRLSVKVLDFKDGAWRVEALYENIIDDSIQAKRNVVAIQPINGVWIWKGILMSEQKCQPGRGHQDFSTDYCI